MPLTAIKTTTSISTTTATRRKRDIRAAFTTSKFRYWSSTIRLPDSTFRQAPSWVSGSPSPTRGKRLSIFQQQAKTEFGVVFGLGYEFDFGGFVDAPLQPWGSPARYREPKAGTRDTTSISPRGIGSICNHSAFLYGKGQILANHISPGKGYLPALAHGESQSSIKLM